MSTRDELRAKIFSADMSKPKSIQIEFFGTQIELRQGTIAQVQQMYQNSLGSDTINVADYLINYAFVPGTEEHIFEAGDKETLMQLPFGKDVQGLTKAMDALLKIDVDDAVKN